MPGSLEPSDTPPPTTPPRPSEEEPQKPRGPEQWWLRFAIPILLALFGTAFTCPDNGRYVAAPDGRVACAQHGTREAPRQGPRPQPGSPAAFMLEGVRRIEASLSFTPDGLTTRLRIE